DQLGGGSRRLPVRPRQPAVRRVLPRRGRAPCRRPHRRPRAGPGRRLRRRVVARALPQRLPGAGPRAVGRLAGPDHRPAGRRGPPRAHRAPPAPARRGRPAPADRGRRLRRLLRLRAPRVQRRQDVPARPGAAAAQLEAPPRGVPRPRRHGRRLGHRRRPPERAAQGAHRGHPHVRAVAAPRHRGRARLRRGHAVHPGRARADGCVRRPRLRRRRAQRLVRPRRPGLGVRPARPVPRQVLRHLDQRLGHAAGRPRRGVDRPAGAAGPAGARLPPRRRAGRARHRGRGGARRGGRRATAVPHHVLVACPDARPHDRERRLAAHRRPLRLGHHLGTGEGPARIAARALVGRPGAVHAGRSGAHVPRGRRRGRAALLRARHGRRTHRPRRGHRAGRPGPV
ncbi:MAG: Fumarylacetoacetase, partial [uncultured Nocardioides sp.]